MGKTGGVMDSPPAWMQPTRLRHHRADCGKIRTTKGLAMDLGLEDLTL